MDIMQFSYSVLIKFMLYAYFNTELITLNAFKSFSIVSAFSSERKETKRYNKQNRLTTETYNYNRNAHKHNSTTIKIVLFENMK